MSWEHTSINKHFSIDSIGEKPASNAPGTPKCRKCSSILFWWTKKGPQTKLRGPKYEEANLLWTANRQKKMIEKRSAYRRCQFGRLLRYSPLSKASFLMKHAARFLLLTWSDQIAHRSTLFGLINFESATSINNERDTCALFILSICVCFPFLRMELHLFC